MYFLVKMGIDFKTIQNRFLCIYSCFKVKVFNKLDPFGFGASPGHNDNNRQTNVFNHSLGSWDQQTNISAENPT